MTRDAGAANGELRDGPKFHDECYACPVGSFFVGVQTAQPDAMEHVLNAAHELLEVARTAIDAAETAIDHQRSGRSERGRSKARVRRIDIV